MTKESEWRKVELSAWNGSDANKKFLLKPGDEMVGVYLGMEEGVGQFEASLFTYRGMDGSRKENNEICKG